MRTCKSLYVLCMEFCIPRIENYSRESFLQDGESDCVSIEDLAGPVVKDLLTHAFLLANEGNKSVKKIWKKEWKIFFTSKILSAFLAWNSDLISHVGRRCKSLKMCEVVVVETFDSDLVLKLPESVLILDFDGELVKRGQVTKTLLFEEETTESWLPHAERILKWVFEGRLTTAHFFVFLCSRALQILRTPPPSDHQTTPNLRSSLCELHLGRVHATSSDLKTILTNCSNLRLLRHYQMVTALYELHVEAWKRKEKLGKYKLRNLDVDFSHVVRCRMSPEWVLSPDALQLAVLLCPSATSIRVRFDCSTPHDVLSPLVNLSKMKEFSAVCVSSGERTLLDFSDMAPILEKHGPNGLNVLELKVIEEVEIHVIIEYCTKLDTLILSGCGYVTPTTCSSFNCQNYERGSFKKLRSLFYADGDDFSWDHGVPDCFWKASLYPSSKTRIVRLQGLFLEFPRMSSSQIKEIFRPSATKLPFPELQALSFCRFEEITVDDIAAICGLSTSADTPCQSLKYIRLSECEKINEGEEKRLRKWLKHSKISQLKIDIDR